MIDALGEFIYRDEKNRLEIVVTPSDVSGYGRGEPSGQIFDMIAYRLHKRYGHDKTYWTARLNAQLTLKYPALRFPGLYGRGLPALGGPRTSRWRSIRSSG